MSEKGPSLLEAIVDTAVAMAGAGNPLYTASNVLTDSDLAFPPVQTVRLFVHEVLHQAACEMGGGEPLGISMQPHVAGFLTKYLSKMDVAISEQSLYSASSYCSEDSLVNLLLPHIVMPLVGYGTAAVALKVRKAAKESMTRSDSFWGRVGDGVKQAASLSGTLLTGTGIAMAFEPAINLVSQASYQDNEIYRAAGRIFEAVHAYAPQIEELGARYASLPDDTKGDIFRIGLVAGTAAAAYVGIKAADKIGSKIKGMFTGPDDAAHTAQQSPYQTPV